MDLLENVYLALAGLRANKMRTLLTMLGIIIGIASVIAIMTLGTSLTNSVTESMQEMGANNITISLQEKSDEDTDSFESQMSEARRMMGAGSGSGNSAVEPEESDYITDDMISTMREVYGNEIQAISITESAGSGKVQDGRLYANVSVMGTNDEYSVVNNLEMQEGRYISQKDILGAKEVAVVSDKLVENIFGNEDPLGREIKLYIGDDIYTYTVVGVYHYKDNNLMPTTAAEQDIQTNLFVPVSSAKKIAGAADGYQYFTVLTTAGTDANTFIEEADSFFDTYYARNQNFGVKASSMESLVEQVNSMMSTMSLAISLIAGISLLVGGIGVMNILLVSITERTKEIGTRKALGATNGSIRMQFITESVIICLIGGAVGIVAGILLGMLGANILGYEASASVGSIFLALGFSMLIGIFFGYYPANKAAKMDPIEALRYE
jgi:putative ABC transport system permease protein